jgi:ribosome maturation factor RimP
MEVQERIRALVEPLVGPLGVELVDVEVLGSGRSRTLRLRVDRDGGVDLGVITDVTRAVSPALDAVDPIDGSYTLEVSSPGLERPLRRPADFRRVLGETITLKTHHDVHGARRLRGVLAGADEEGIEVEVEGKTLRVAHADVASARTVFEWGPAPRSQR